MSFTITQPTIKTWDLIELQTIKTKLDLLTKEQKDEISKIIIEGSIALKTVVDSKEP